MTGERINMSLSKNQCFEVLEISPTSDIKIIKKAYSKMIRKYHPEDNPDMYNLVREAYEYLNSLYNQKQPKNNIIFRNYEEKSDGKNLQNNQSTLELSKEKKDALKSPDDYGERLEDEIKRIADEYASKEKQERNAGEYKKYRELIVLLKDIKILRDDRQLLNMEVFLRMRRSPLFLQALQYNYFVILFTDALRDVSLHRDASAILKNDIESVKSVSNIDYSKLLQVLEENCLDEKETKKLYKPITEKQHVHISLPYFRIGRWAKGAYFAISSLATLVFLIMVLMPEYRAFYILLIISIINCAISGFLMFKEL